MALLHGDTSPSVDRRLLLLVACMSQMSPALFGGQCQWLKLLLGEAPSSLSLTHCVALIRSVLFACCFVLNGAYIPSKDSLSPPTGHQQYILSFLLYIKKKP